ncbi:MAG: hypothetical protein PHI59_05800, partial [Candidatus Omnitrophica bacterium]|nr:hypothetical protein [Candidatus Omnitrophota bacterium]
DLKRLIAALLIATAVFVIRGAFPHAALQEGHNIFFTKGSGETLEKELPSEVYGFMKQQFLRRYPLDKRAGFKNNAGCWGSPVPQSLFTFSADSVFSNPKYSRIVDDINFSNLTEFRGGFANSSDYNWYGASDIKRESMPFFVMYELSPASVNSSLCWTGFCLWEDLNGHYQLIYNQTAGCRKITRSDIGKKVFGVAINSREQSGFWSRFKGFKAKIKSFFSNKKTDYVREENVESSLSMHLILSPVLRFSAVLKKVVEILAVFLILNLMVRIDRRRFLLASLIIAIAAIIVCLYCPHLFGQYYIHEGGEDGMTHETLGRGILINVLSGNFMEALRAGEDVFWNTPGFRYFRALEKLFFGDTNFGNLAVTLILPYVLFGFLANFISKKWAFWATMVFILGIFPGSHPLHNNGFATYYGYVMVTRGGWPDVVAYTAFLGALTLLLRYAKTQNGAYFWYGFLAHFLLFVTVFMRPQFAITVLIVVVYFAGKLMVNRRFKEIFLSWLGFTPIFFPLWHNYFFGRKLYLFTGSVQMAVTMPPSVYIDACKELLASGFSGQNVTNVILHLRCMVRSWYQLILLGVVFYAAFLKRRVPSDMRMVAIVCLSMHFVNLFIFATYFRYVLLTWTLSAIVAIFLVWLWVNKRKGSVEN